ncbi:MAG: endonuclease [Planctomycetes bacterium]|nr:endonuclease [Planctomycetota bacterium]
MSKDKSKAANRYSQLIEAVFLKHYEKGDREVVFERTDIVEAAKRLKVTLPKNLGDVVYSFRYRTELPREIAKEAPKGDMWVIRGAGRARYKFELVSVANADITPSKCFVETKIPDGTPGVIDKYALNDEQALLAKIRYNRLVDIFTGLTCYSLQNHLRTSVTGLGQVETDEIYVGIDRRGAHYALPVEAKGKKERIGIVQIEQDVAVCHAKFPDLICHPIAAQFMDDDFIALFQFEVTQEGIAIASEKHYRLVPPEELSPEELQAYQDRPL